MLFTTPFVFLRGEYFFLQSARRSGQPPVPTPLLPGVSAQYSVSAAAMNSAVPVMEVCVGDVFEME